MITVTNWQAGEIAAFRLFNKWSREQGLATSAWDRASVTGNAVGLRPVATPPLDLQARARAAA